MAMTTTNKRKAADGDAERVAAIKRSRTDSAINIDTDNATALNDSTTTSIVPAPVVGSPFQNKRKSASDNTTSEALTASIFGGPCLPNPVSLKRKAGHDIESDGPFTKRATVKTAENKGDTDALVTALVPAGHPTPTNPPATHNTGFPFLQLPAEIRLQIYTLLFKLRKPVYPQLDHLPADKNKNARSGFRKGLVLSMVLANRQLSREVTHFLYSNNTFRLTMRYHRDWVARIGRRNSNLVQEVILVGGGRPKTAADQIYSTLVILWKRACVNLRRITVQDEWYCFDSSYVVQQLLEFGKKRSWNAFLRLEHITVDVSHVIAPRADEPLYQRLAKQARVPVTARHCVGSWNMPLQMTERGWRAAGQVWLEVACPKKRKTPVDATEKKKRAEAAEEKKRAAVLKKQVEAAAWIEAEFAKSLEQNGSGQQGNGPSA